MGLLQRDTPRFPIGGAYFPQLCGSGYWPQMEPYVDWITPQWYSSAGNSLVCAYEDFVAGSQTGQALPADRILGGQNTAHTSLSDLTSAITTLNGKYGENWGASGSGPTLNWTPRRIGRSRSTTRSTHRSNLA